MANIVDYSKRYANVSMKEMPYNEVDGLILSELSYIHWDNIVPGVGEPSQLTLQQAIILLKQNNPKYFKSLDANHKQLLNEIANSSAGTNDRYGSMIISNFDAPKNVTAQEVSSRENVRQFAAVTFSFSDGAGTEKNVLAYRGTDCSLAGWQENFNMAFDLHTESQKAAKNYLNKVGKSLDGEIVLAGHSKGGNNASYAYLYCNDAVRERIVKVQSYDGPGLPKQTTKNKNYARMLEVMEGNSAPYDSVIGLLLCENRFQYVDTNKGMMDDHDGYSWQVDIDNASFVHRKQSEVSKLVNLTVDNLVAFLPLESKKYLVNSIFNFIYSDSVPDYDNDGKDFDDVLNYIKKEKFHVLVDVWNADISIADKGMIYSALVVACFLILPVSFVELTIVECINVWIAFGQEFIPAIKEKIDSLVDWSKENIQKFKNCIQEGFNTALKTVESLLNKLFDSKSSRAAVDPQIVLDTYKLRSYAERIMNVNRRLANLDRRMDSLYKSVGLLDLWNLLQADLCTKYSWRLLRAAEYLNDTAADFEAAETELANA